MVLVPFAGLVSEPVHKESVREVVHEDGAEHNDDEAERAEAGHETERQREGSDRLGHDDQERDDRGNKNDDRIPVARQLATRRGNTI